MGNKLVDGITEYTFVRDGRTPSPEMVKAIKLVPSRMHTIDIWPFLKVWEIKYPGVRIQRCVGFLEIVHILRCRSEVRLDPNGFVVLKTMHTLLDFNLMSNNRTPNWRGFLNLLTII